jgi:LPS-assembly lipoprotein
MFNNTPQNTFPLFVKFALVILFSSVLSACGFHLRGDYSVPQNLQKLSITSFDQYSTFTRMLKTQLRMSEIEIVEPAEDVPNLHIISEGMGERTLSLYQNTNSAEQELTFKASYSVTIPEKGSLNLSTSVSRSYLANSLTALAKSVERDMLEDEMRKIATDQIIRQLARLKLETLLESNNVTEEPLPLADEQNKTDQSSEEAPVSQTTKVAE